MKDKVKVPEISGLNLDDVDFILTALEYTRLKFEDYTGYPTYEFKQERVNDVCIRITKMAAIRDELRKRLPLRKCPNCGKKKVGPWPLNLIYCNADCRKEFYRKKKIKGGKHGLSIM